MFDGERGKLRVSDEVAADIQLIDQLSEDLGGPLRCFRDPAAGRHQPIRDMKPGFARGEGPGEYPRMGRDAEKGTNGWPRQRNAAWTGKGPTDPIRAWSVMTRAPVDRVEQDVRVKKHGGCLRTDLDAMTLAS